MLFKTSKNSWYFINQGIIMLNYNDFRKALSLFNKALALEPENLVAQFHRGSTLYKLERTKEALQSLEKVIQGDPKNIDALLNKGLH